MVAPRYSNSWLEGEPTSRFGLSSELLTVLWRGEGSTAGKLAEAKNYSHSRIAYPRFDPESMAPMRESVSREILANDFVTNPLPSLLDEALRKKDASVASFWLLGPAPICRWAQHPVKSWFRLTSRFST